MSTATAATVDLTFDEDDDPIVAQESKVQSEYVDREDICHVTITDVIPRTGDDDETVGFAIVLEVLQASDGNEDLVGKKHFEDFYFAKASHKDGGKFAQQRQKVLLMATGKVDPMLKGGPYTIEYSKDQFLDYQFICHFKEKPQQKKNGDKKKAGDTKDERKYFHIDGLKMWHVDDPEVATVNKDAELLQYAQGQRWDEAQKKAVVAKREEARAAAESAKGAKKAGKTGQPLPKGKAAESQLSDDDLDSL